MTDSNNNNNNGNSNNGNKPPFSTDLVKQLITHGLQTKPEADGPIPHLSKEAAELTADLLRLFVQEAQHRASIEAECDLEGGLESNTDKPVIRADHISKIAAEMLMDFS
jgi:CENP-S associating Centromere protein X